MDIGLYMSPPPVSDHRRVLRHAICAYSWAMAGFKDIYLVSDNNLAVLLCNQLRECWPDVNWTAVTAEQGIKFVRDTSIPCTKYHDAPVMDSLFEYVASRGHKYSALGVADTFVDASFLTEIASIYNKHPNLVTMLKRWSYDLLEPARMAIYHRPLPSLKGSYLATVNAISDPRQTHFPRSTPDDSNSDLAYADWSIFPTAMIQKDRPIAPMVRGAVFDTDILTSWYLEYAPRVVTVDHLIKITHEWHAGRSSPEDLEYKYNHSTMHSDPLFLKHVKKTPNRDIRVDEITEWNQL